MPPDCKVSRPKVSLSLMEKKHISIPAQKDYEYAYELAYKIASERLAGITDIEQQCHRVGATFRIEGAKQVIIIQYLNRSYQVTLPDIEITLAGSSDKIPIRDKVLILRYLSSAKSASIASELITYKELPGGVVYFPTFIKRTIKPLLKKFGKEPPLLVEAGKRLGGHKADYGDVSITIPAFSQVPVTIAIWRGDEEFAPEGSILFEPTISDYLSNEDITVLCETITWKLIGYSGGGLPSGGRGEQ